MAHVQAQSIGFTLDGVTARPFADWGRAGVCKRASSAMGQARAYARANGVALMWRSDGVLIVHYVEGGKLRKKTYPRAHAVRLEARQ